MEVAEAVSLALEDLHFGVEAFGDAVVASEAPHGDDFFRPGRKGLAELDQGCQAGLTQLIDGAEKARDQLFTLFAGAMFFQQQVAEPLFEAIDRFQRRMLGQISLEAKLLIVLLGFALFLMDFLPAHL